MIGYVTIGTDDLERAAGFYDVVLGALGATKFATTDRMLVYGTAPTEPMLMLCTPFDEQGATGGNGTMVALKVDSQEKVDAVYAKAIELGAKDEGAPGPRGNTGGYFGYFRDADGNKLAVFVMGG